MKKKDLSTNDFECKENEELLITDKLARFEILKPAQWFLTPTRWFLDTKRKMFDEKSAIVQLSNYAQDPFLVMMHDHHDQKNAFPTVQVNFRTLLNPFIDHEATLLQSISMLSKLFKDFHLIEASSKNIISQKPSNYIKSTYTITGNYGSFRCCARSYTIFCTSFAYTVGISGPDSEDHDFEQTYDRIQDSIRILI
jgi:hypothetical protein